MFHSSKGLRLLRTSHGRTVMGRLSVRYATSFAPVHIRVVVFVRLLDVDGISRSFHAVYMPLAQSTPRVLSRFPTQAETVEVRPSDIYGLTDEDVEILATAEIFAGTVRMRIDIVERLKVLEQFLDAESGCETLQRPGLRLVKGGEVTPQDVLPELTVGGLQ